MPAIMPTSTALRYSAPTCVGCHILSLLPCVATDAVHLTGLPKQIRSAPRHSIAAPRIASPFRCAQLLALPVHFLSWLLQRFSHLSHSMLFLRSSSFLSAFPLLVVINPRFSIAVRPNTVPLLCVSECRLALAFRIIQGLTTPLPSLCTNHRLSFAHQISALLYRCPWARYFSAANQSTSFLRQCKSNRASPIHRKSRQFCPLPVLLCANQSLYIAIVTAQRFSIALLTVPGLYRAAASQCTLRLSRAHRSIATPKRDFSIAVDSNRSIACA